MNIFFLFRQFFCFDHEDCAAFLVFLKTGIGSVSIVRFFHRLQPGFKFRQIAGRDPGQIKDPFPVKFRVAFLVFFGTVIKRVQSLKHLIAVLRQGCGTGFQGSGYLRELTEGYADVQFSLFQSNHEGSLIDELQRVGFDCDGIVLNAGGYTHTSIAIADAIAAITAPVVEVHISDIYSREPLRHVSMIKDACVHSIVGHGLDGYRMAIEYLMKNAPHP